MHLSSNLFQFLLKKTSGLYDLAVIKVQMTENLSGTTLRINTDKVERRLYEQLEHHLFLHNKYADTITLRWNIESRDPAR